MAKKLMIFGGSGFVGGNMAKMAHNLGWKVHIADCFYRPGIDEAEWKTVDITDRECVKKVIEEVNPNAVVNVAAVADIDKAERDRELAWKVNVEGATNLALGCAKQGIRYVFFSSDAVFSGKATMYTEEDLPDPINYYGRTKAEAEKAVLLVHPEAVVVRISLVLGFPVTGGNAFFANLEKKLKEGSSVPCAVDEIRTPVDVLTLCECILELCDSSFKGILHIGATNSVNRYELAKKAAVLMGFDENLIIEQATQDAIPARAPRHKNGIISVSKAQGILKTKLLDADETIRRAIRERL